MQTRRFPRYPLDRPIRAVVFWDDMPSRKIQGRTFVISEGGVGALLFDQVSVGDVVRLDMAPLPSVYATVRNQRGNRYGFEFLYSQPGQRNAVTGVCAAADNEPDATRSETAKPWR